MVAMLYAQLSGASSLRVLELSFNSHRIHHRIAGAGVVRRSTLADANERRTGEVFDDTAAWLMTQVSRKLRQESSEFMYLLDSTSITLKGREFDQWTLNNRTRNTQGIKLHMLLDAGTVAPAWYCLSAPNVNDIEQAHHAPLQPDGLYVFDKGYCDFNWWKKIDANGAHFVTRFKTNVALVVQHQRSIPLREKGAILSDEIVYCKRRYVSKRRINSYDNALRRIVVRRPDKVAPLVLATNDLQTSASDIAQRYKERWAIELFFKWLKQHLKIKTFFGRSANAVHNQIVIALICYLLVALYREAHRLSCTLWQVLSLISANLFEPAVTDTTLDMMRRRRRTTSTLPKHYS
jgi:IS4 transposase